MDNCHRYGIEHGCDIDCPVLLEGNCELQDDENKTLYLEAIKKYNVGEWTDMKKIEKFIKGDTIVLRNVPIKWAKLTEPDRPPWGGSSWKINAVLTEEQAKAFKEVGFRVKQDGNSDWYISCERKEITSKGKKQDPPRIIGRDGMPSQEHIGNGSVCNIKVWCKYWETAGDSGLKPYLDTVQIVDLVEYDGENALTAIKENAPTETPSELPF